MCRTRGCLTSAISGLAVHAIALGDGESGEVLGAGWMDPDCAVKVCLGCTKLDSHSIALSDLASVRTEHMCSSEKLLLFNQHTHGLYHRHRTMRYN